MSITGETQNSPRLGFGCSSIMRLPAGRQRQALLHAAYDSGIRHFDVARMYGLGRAEAEVGRFARGRRAEISIATKFGIAPATGLASMARVQAPLRAALERFPVIRRAIKRRSDSFATPRRYDASTARTSLEMSLRELGVDYVDFLFVHDPRPVDDVGTEELLDFFASQKQKGTIRAWGVSQDAYPDLNIVEKLGQGAVLQIRDDILRRRASTRPVFTFGVLQAAHLNITSALLANGDMRARWSAELGWDPCSSSELADLLVAEALEANPAGLVLYNSLKPDRIARAARVAQNHLPEDRITALRELVAADKSAIPAASP